MSFMGSTVFDGSVIRFYWVLLGFTGFYWLLLSLTGLLLSLTRVLLCFTGFYCL